MWTELPFNSLGMFYINKTIFAFYMCVVVFFPGRDLFISKGTSAGGCY